MPISDRERQNFFHPRKPDEKIKTRKDRFDTLNRYCADRNGWITSIPGAPVIALECLEGAALPDELRELGYVLSDAGAGQRILPHAIVADVITEGSTVPIRVQHAGIVTVRRYSFSI